MDDTALPVVGPADLHHLTRVLRLRAGEEVVATDGHGRWVLCRFTGAHTGGAARVGRAEPGHAGTPGARGAGVLEPAGPVRTEPPALPAVTVAFCPVKGERPEWVVQKLTELGVDRIVVLAAERSVVRWDDRRARAAMDRLGRVAVEATAQCRRVWLPQLVGPLSLDDFCDQTPGAALAEPGAAPLPAGTSAVAVGPEGGWSLRELESGAATVGLGPNVLRAETAALAAGALLIAHRAGTVGGRHG